MSCKRACMGTALTALSTPYVSDGYHGCQESQHASCTRPFFMTALAGHTIKALNILEAVLLRRPRYADDVKHGSRLPT